MSWDRDGLQSRGFQGFVPFVALPTAQVPVGEGVYVVIRPSSAAPTFLDRSCGGWFKGKDPTVATDVLERAWVPNASVLNFGKASLGASGKRGLRKRLDEYRRFGAGEPVGHYGGRYIWQLADSAELLVAWQAVPEPRAVEATLIAEFMSVHGKRPFANLTG